ncbi:MAG: hypothetical protein WBL95_15290 [Microcoleus sp.]
MSHNADRVPTSSISRGSNSDRVLRLIRLIYLTLSILLLTNSPIASSESHKPAIAFDRENAPTLLSPTGDRHLAVIP